jgi:integrase
MKNKRSANRTGYLYKIANNKMYPANSPVKGLYWLQISLNGKRKQIALKNEEGQRITDFKEAQSVRQKIIAPLLFKEEQDILNFILSALKVEHRSFEEHNVLISDSIKKYLKLRSNDELAKRYIKQTIRASKKFIKFVLKKNPNKLYITEITTEEVREFLDKYKNASPRTYNSIIKYLAIFFTTVMEDYKNSNDNYKNPCANIKVKTLNSSNQFSKRVLTTEEVQKILEEAKKIGDDVYLLFLIGAFTGLRLGDVCELKWSDIYLEEGLIKKLASKTKRFGSKPVIIGIPEQLKIELKKLELKKTKEEELFKQWNQQKLEQPHRNVHKIVKEVFKNAGIQTLKIIKGRRINIVGYHSLRHTFITRHAELGTPLSVIQAFVGHSNSSMTQHYAQISEQKIKEASQNFKLLYKKKDY